jgi:hypothetical protein
LHPKLYRKLLPTITDDNIGEHGGLERLSARIRSGQVIVSHLRFDARYPDVLRRRGVGVVFLIRDPRDMAVSRAHYVSRTMSHPHHDLFAARPDRERLRLAIVGDVERGVPSLRERLDAFAGWLDGPWAVIRFEDLIGPDGGGDRSSQLRTVRFLYGSLGVQADDALIRSVCRVLFSPASPTFRLGAIGQWRTSFDPELERLMEEVVGDAMVRYGYLAASASS